MRACKPGLFLRGNSQDKVSYMLCSSGEMRLQDFENTLRLFISDGEDIEEALKTNVYITMNSLFYLEPYGSHSQPLLFDYIISFIGTDAFDEEWWTRLLREAMHEYPQNVITTILPFCNRRVAREVLVEELGTSATFPDKGYLQKLRSLFEKAGGLSLFSSCCFSDVSLIEMISETSFAVARLKYILDSLGISKKDFIPPDVELQELGWTVQTLSLLLEYPVPIYEQIFIQRSFGCKKCNSSIYTDDLIQFILEIPWQRKVQRIKDGLDPDGHGPLTEEENVQQEIWDGYVKAEEEDICQSCHTKDLEKKAEGEVYGLGLNCFSY